MWLAPHPGSVWGGGAALCHQCPKPGAQGAPEVPLGTLWEEMRGHRCDACISQVAGPWGQGQAPRASSALVHSRLGEQQVLRLRGGVGCS